MASWHAAPRRRIATLAVLLALPGLASAQQGPISADPEFVVPNFGKDMVPGVPVPEADVRNTVRWGVVFQYQRNPVTGYRLDEEVATIVANRLAAQFGFSWDFASWGSLYAVVPTAVNWGTEIVEFDATGVGLGDIGVGLQLLPVRTRHFNLGLHGNLFLPTGQSNAYIGEESVRGGGGVNLLGRAYFKDLITFELIGNAAVTARKVLVTNHDFDLGPELVISEGARIRLARLPVDVALTQALIVRGQFTNFFQGGAENGIEVYGGVQVPFRSVAYNTDIILDVMAGRGTNQGYGTTDFRMLAGLTFSRNPGRKPAVVKVAVEAPPPVVPPIVQDDPPPPPPDVRVFRELDQIVIRDPIQFFVDTANIMPQSLPTLEDVAEIINKDARIKHLVIEGHASEEGTFEYNYELSKSRAEAIFKQLIRNGVAPDRLSYRAFGEVRPKVAGSTEEIWAINRRVEFHIVSEFGKETVTWPEYGATTVLPWDGSESRVVTPPNPDQVEEQRLRELYEKQRRDEFRDGTDEDVEIGADAPTLAPTRPLGVPERDDAFRGQRFDAPSDEDLTLDDAAPPAPVEAE